MNIDQAVLHQCPSTPAAPLAWATPPSAAVVGGVQRRRSSCVRSRLAVVVAATCVLAAVVCWGGGCWLGGGGEEMLAAPLPPTPAAASLSGTDEGIAKRAEEGHEKRAHHRHDDARRQQRSPPRRNTPRTIGEMRTLCATEGFGWHRGRHPHVYAARRPVVVGGASTTTDGAPPVRSASNLSSGRLLRGGGPTGATAIPQLMCVQDNAILLATDDMVGDDADRHRQDDGAATRGRNLPLQYRQDAAVFSSRRLTEDELLSTVATAAAGGRGGNEATAGAESTAVVFHPTLAVTISSLWNSVNFFHLLMDGLVAALYWIDTELADGGAHGSFFIQNGDHNGNDARFTSARLQRRRPSAHMDVVLLGNRTFLYERNRKALCQTCVAYAKVITTGSGGEVQTAHRHVQPIVADGTDRRMHCFCGGVVFGMNRLPPFGRDRRLGMRSFQERLVALYGERPYGEVPQVADFTKYGYWRGGGNASVLAAPRLLFVKRHRRRIGHSEGIEALAEALGFNVAAVYFEELSPAVQFHLSRYADVLMGIHGMALTYVANMDGGGGDGGSGGGDGSRSCRTLIELMHWVNPTKFYIYREMASLTGVAFQQLLPQSVSFGSTVAHPGRERVLLMKPKFYWWSLNGFDDQTVAFDAESTRRALLSALHRAQRCVQ